MSLQDENIPPLVHSVTAAAAAAAAAKIDGSSTAITTQNQTDSATSLLHGVHRTSNRLPFANHAHSISNQEHFSALNPSHNNNNSNNNNGYVSGFHNQSDSNNNDMTESRHLRAVSGVSMFSPFQTRRRMEVHDENNETVNESTTNYLDDHENEIENNETLTDINNPNMNSDHARRMSLKRRPPTDLQDENKRVRLEDSVIHNNENQNSTNNNDNNNNNNNTNSHKTSNFNSTSEIAIISDTSSYDEEIVDDNAENIQPLQRRVLSAHEERIASLPALQYDNLDLEDADDPLMVSEYVEDIFKYFYETEVKMLPDPNYLQIRTELRPRMRSILVDWMVEVHLKFKLLPETLYLAINIMDRFLSKEVVQVDRLQLLATGSLFIAAKYEEVYSPSIKNYAYVTDGAFTEEEILGAEKFILEILNFNMAYPNPLNFLRRISKADDYNVHTRTIAKYLLEITVVDHRFIGYLPSLCAAAAMFIARKMIGKNDWNANLIHYSGDYTKKHLEPVCEMIMDYLKSPVVHEEFFRKYASRRFLKVSILARTWARESVRSMSSIMD
ncbi:hypothetical protein CANINC_001620 [Pichia inconspicua]|uniref:Uncharacterized protein n=1 Tax=Pichia inconspicua TaxID=52247 RepID=A0A4T0X3L5_9ASCO|nr:hypothetical protein CANINC_001620 [[Candida] inconspicua]